LFHHPQPQNEEGNKNRPLGWVPGDRDRSRGFFSFSSFKVMRMMANDLKNLIANLEKSLEHLKTIQERTRHAAGHERIVLVREHLQTVNYVLSSIAILEHWLVDIQRDLEGNLKLIRHEIHQSGGPVSENLIKDVRHEVAESLQKIQGLSTVLARQATAGRALNQ
jgi:hypothetical protein